MSQSVAAAPRAGARRAAYVTAGAVGSAVVITLGNSDVTPGEQGGLVPAVVCSVLCLVTAVLLFGVVLARVRRPVRTTVVLGVLAVLSLAVFWTGVTPLLAAAALSVPAGQPPGRAVSIWRVLSVMAALLVLAWSVADQLLHR